MAYQVRFHNGEIPRGASLDDARKCIEAARKIGKPGTHLDIGGKVPTAQEAEQLIQEEGGTINRGPETHDPGGVSTHTYPHINYTRSSGAKAAVRVQ